MQQELKKPPWTSSGNLTAIWDATIEQEWRVMSEVYEEFLETAMPSREEVLRRGTRRAAGESR